MNPSKTELVPFGKYRGQPVEVLASDQPYFEWLSAQPWFRERYQNIYMLIINNFAEPACTPEHNRMQVRWLERGYVSSFLRDVVRIAEHHLDSMRREAASSHRSEIIKTEKNIEWNKRGIHLCRMAPAGIQREKTITEYELEIGADEEKIAEHEVLAAEIMTIGTEDFRITAAKQFEVGGWDVVLLVTVSSKALSSERSSTILIELKPLIGDDYPAVLRQVQKARQSGLRFVIYDRFEASGATLDRVEEIFATAGVRLVASSAIAS